MATRTVERLVHAEALAAGATAAVYSVPAGKKAVVYSATLCNPTGAVVTANVYITSDGGTPSNSNVIISSRSIAAGETYTCPEMINQALENEQEIHASGSGVNFTVSGLEIVE